MQGFEKDYKILLNKAKSILQKNNYNLSPEDLINEVFLQFYDKKIPYKLELFVLNMRNYFCIEKTIIVNNHQQNVGIYFEHLTCLKCKKERDSSEFNKIRITTGVYVQDKTCKICRRPENAIAVKSYWAKQKENLTDVYIKSLLSNDRKHQKIKRSEITKEQIDMKRMQLKKEPLVDTKGE